MPDGITIEMLDPKDIELVAPLWKALLDHIAELPEAAVPDPAVRAVVAARASRDARGARRARRSSSSRAATTPSSATPTS